MTLECKAANSGESVCVLEWLGVISAKRIPEKLKKMQPKKAYYIFL